MDIYDPTDEFDDDLSEDLPTVEEIDSHHDSVVEEYDIKYTGVNAFNPSETMYSILQDADKQEDPYEKAAVLLRRLPVTHIYEDGNKRTTWLTVTDYLDRKGFDYPQDAEEIDKVLKQIRSFDIEELADWLETGEIELRR
jgi:death-on-curing protein